MLISGNVRHAIIHLHANFVKLVSSKVGRGANMGPGLSFITFVLFWLLAFVNSKPIEPSGKVDFEDTSSEEPPAKMEKPIPTKISVKTDSIGTPSHVTTTVSCGPTGCNTTSNNNSVETQILVHVQTKVQFDPSQGKKILEDAADVPVVVGYRGSAPEYDDESSRNTPGRFEHNYGSSRGDFPPSKPFYSDPSVSLGFSNHKQGEPSGDPYQGSYRPATNGYREYSSTSGPFEPYRPANSLNNYFGSSTSRPLDSINSPTPVRIPDPNRRNFNYNHRDNGANLQIPYFEHSYNKHYFNEEPPPHTIWLGKGVSHNPVEFRNIPRDQWRPVFWNGRNNKYSFSDSSRNLDGSYQRSAPDPGYYQQEYRPRIDEPECSCRDHRTERSHRSDRSTPDSVSRSRVMTPYKGPARFIDDKLSPLN